MAKSILSGIVGWILAIAIWLGGLALPQLLPKGTRYSGTRGLWIEREVQTVAHRGLSGLTLENTVQAFELAGQSEHYGIEADVRVTADGRYIIFHDSDLERIAGLDIEIEKTDYDTLRALRFKDPYADTDEEFYLPSLEEYIEICVRYDKQSVLELKGDMTLEEVCGVVAVIQGYGWFERTTFISFSAENLLRLKEGYPTASAQYIIEEWTDENVNFMIENQIDADLRWDLVKSRRVKQLHNAGLQVNCWTVDGQLCAAAMVMCGVDFITTNILV
ncbi:MAG: hypothetical protein IKB20_04680 [Clostridia bacterium]|nr:hypothetical protein [Clostridia bacterium]